MKNILKYTLVLLFTFTTALAIGQNKYVDLSVKLIEAARYDKPYQSLLDTLATVEVDVLADALKTDDEKKAFWINVYNANVQFLLTENPELFDDRGAFFKEPRVTVAGKKLSFDDIEHGIIRRSKNKLSLGFLPKLCVDKYEKKFRTKKVDGRIHFALNCGAKSCPAVAAYHSDAIDQELDTSTKIHLNNTSRYDEQENKVYITSLFSWFRGDFGNKNKVIEFLKKYEVLPADADPDIEYNKYDWTLSLGNYIDLEA